MDLSRSEIDNISHANKSDIDCCCTMLQTWFHVNQDVTWEDFLSKIDLSYLVSEIKNALSVPQTIGLAQPTELDRKYSTMICKVWDHLTKKPKNFGMLCIKLKFTQCLVDNGLDDPNVYKNPDAFLSALKENKIISRYNVSWLKYLVEDLPACSKIVNRYDRFVAATTKLAIQRRFSSKGECMQPLT